MKQNKNNSILRFLRYQEKGFFIAKIFESLKETIYRKKTANSYSLVTKKLILDNIVTDRFFYSRIFKEYKNSELAEYLSKYLTFWKKQKNKHGPYFLDHYRSVEDLSSLIEGTYGDLEDWGSPFSNLENENMNDLPESRNEIAVIQLLGEKIKFRKINHFLNFFEFLNSVYNEYNVKFTGNNSIFGKNQMVDYENCTFSKHLFLLKYPKVKVETFTFPLKWDYENGIPGYFFIDWDKTNSNINSYNWSLNNNKKGEIEDYIQFLNLLNIGLWVEQQDIPHYYQFFQELKIKINLDCFKNDGKMSKIQILEYLEMFINILTKALSNKNKIQAFLKINKIEIIKQVFKNRTKYFMVKIKKLNKKLLIPLFLGICLIFYVRFLFPFLFFTFFNIFLIRLMIKTRNKRSFPSFKAYLFDFKENFFSRLSIKTIVLIYLILRLIVVIKIIHFEPFEMSPQYMLAVKRNTEQKILGKTLSIIVSKEQNIPLSLTETGLLLNKTSLIFSQEFRKIAYFENYRNNQIFAAWQNSRVKRNEFFPKISMENFPWKSKENCIYPSLIETESSQYFNSFQEISEVFYPFVASYSNYDFKPNLSSVIYQNNLKIEGEFILNDTVCDVKAPKFEVITNPEKMFFIPENLKKGKFFMAKVIQTIKQNYHYLIILDVTHLELTDKDFLGIKKAFKSMIEKYPEIFGSWENRKCEIIFKKTIPGLENQIIKTNITEAILQNYQLIKSLETFEDLISEAETRALSKNNGLTKESNNFSFKTYVELEELQTQQKFIPINEIRNTGIIEKCRGFKLLLRKPQIWFTEIPFIENPKKIPTPNCLETAKFLKEGENEFEKKIKESFLDLPPEVKEMQQLEQLPDTVLSNGERIHNLSTGTVVKPLPEVETRMVVYNPEFANRQKWRSENSSKSIKSLEELYPELKKSKNKK